MDICPDIDKTVSPCKHYITTDEPGFCARGDRYSCIEYIIRKRPVISGPYIEDYLRCKRKFYYSRIMGWELNEINLIPFNASIVYDLVAHAHGDVKFYLDRARIKQSHLSKHYENKLPNECLYISPIIRAYRELGLNKQGSYVHFSKTLTANQFTLKGSVCLEYDDTLMYIKYTKNNDYQTFFNIEYQAAIAFILFPAKSKIIFRCITKPQGNKAKNDSIADYQDRLHRDILQRPGHYFIDKPFYSGEFDTARVMEELLIHADEIKWRVSKGHMAYWPQTRSACFAYGYRCDFLSCCEARVDPVNVPNLYKQKDVEDNIFTGG